MTRRLALIIGGLVAVAAIDGAVNGPTVRTAILTFGWLAVAGIVSHTIDRRAVRS